MLGTKFFGNLYTGDPNGGGAGRKPRLPGRREPHRAQLAFGGTIVDGQAWDEFPTLASSSNRY